MPSSWRRSARISLLAHRALDAGVQVIIEGAGGHIRSDRIPGYIRYYKKQSPFPLFVAGPLPTDIGVGYDHICRGLRGKCGKLLPGQIISVISHRPNISGLPSPDAVKEGLIAFRIAAHIGDTVKYGRDAAGQERCHAPGCP